MTKTEFKSEGKTVSYEILEDGYIIYIGGVASIHQYEPYIPYPDLSYEEGCLKQIGDLVSSQQQQEDTANKEQQIEALQEQVNMLTEAIMEMSADVYGE